MSLQDALDYFEGMKNDNPGSVIWWWTPDCGYLHVETDPILVDLVHCPDHIDPPEDTG